MGIGVSELLIILVVILIIFGAGKLPRVMGDLGKGVKSFREGMKEGEEDEKKKRKPSNGDDVVK